LDPRTYEGGHKLQVQTQLGDGTGDAAHGSLAFAKATSDLPSFGFADPLEMNDSDAEDMNQQDLLRTPWAEGASIGFKDGDGRVPYATVAKTSAQRSSRIAFTRDNKATLVDQLQGHIVGPTSALTASRLSHIRIVSTGHGNHLGGWERRRSRNPEPRGKGDLTLCSVRYSRVCHSSGWTTSAAPSAHPCECKTARGTSVVVQDRSAVRHFNVAHGRRD
jgi:hypothetical protein